MENKEGYLEFVHSESYKNQIDVWYRAYNISREKTELFYDFLMSLYNLLQETYLGPEVFELEEDQKNHFTWCWDKTIENFNKESVEEFIRLIKRNPNVIQANVDYGNYKESALNKFENELENISIF